MQPEWRFIENWMETSGVLLPSKTLDEIRLQLQCMRVQCVSTRSTLSALAEYILKTEFDNSERRLAAALVLEAKMHCNTDKGHKDA